MTDKNKTKKPAKPELSWADCQTGREQQSKILTKLLLNKHEHLRERVKADPRIINTYSLNIDSPWGMGKTFFIERWANDLTKDGYITLMFNAWKYDYSKDALTCLLSVIYSQINEKFSRLGKKSKINKQIGVFGEGIKKIIKRSIPTIIGTASMAAFGVPAGGLLTSKPQESGADDAATKTMEILGEEFANEMFKNREGYDKALQEFRKGMDELIYEIQKTGKQLPIFIFIDDLDRCRPDFTLEIIECIKHILEIDNLYFIFATDATQLQLSLKAVHGDGIDSEKYLKRIFNRECHLIQPNQEKFSDYIFKDDFAISGLSPDKVLFPEKTENIAKGLSKWFSYLSQAYGLDLRTQVACKDQIEDLLNLRKDEVTFAFVLMHLVILWNINKKNAEKQLDQVSAEKEPVKVDVKISTISRKNPDSTRYNIRISSVITSQYSCAGKVYSELHKLHERADTAIEKYIFAQAGDIVKAQDMKIEYLSMFKQIKMIS